MHLIQNQYSTLYVLQDIHSETFNIYTNINTNNVGIVSWENFEMEEYIPKIIDELLSLR